jgi:hypothetical protein
MEEEACDQCEQGQHDRGNAGLIAQDQGQTPQHLNRHRQGRADRGQRQADRADVADRAGETADLGNAGGQEKRSDQETASQVQGVLQIGKHEELLLKK